MSTAIQTESQKYFMKVHMSRLGAAPGSWSLDGCYHGGRIKRAGYDLEVRGIESLIENSHLRAFQA
jgi:hypothetical protein